MSKNAYQAWPLLGSHGDMFIENTAFGRMAFTAECHLEQ